MYVASLALVVLAQGSVPAQDVKAANQGASILTSYEDAYNRAGQEGKPILILFTNQSRPSELQALQSQGVLNDFLVVVADKNTAAGRHVFANFQWPTDEGCSVIERNRQWQFARYERKLSGDELARVVNGCRGAAGFPTFDPLTTNVAAYPPAQQGQPAAQAGTQAAQAGAQAGRAVQQGVQAQAGVAGQQSTFVPAQQGVSVQHGQFMSQGVPYGYPSTQFYPQSFPMMGGGGCIGGSCGGGFPMMMGGGGCIGGSCGGGFRGGCAGGRCR